MRFFKTVYWTLIWTRRNRQNAWWLEERSSNENSCKKIGRRIKRTFEPQQTTSCHSTCLHVSSDWGYACRSSWGWGSTGYRCRSEANLRTTSSIAPEAKPSLLVLTVGYRNPPMLHTKYSYIFMKNVSYTRTDLDQLDSDKTVSESTAQSRSRMHISLIALQYIKKCLHFQCRHKALRI